jgi:hypothetical protein
VYRNSCTSWGGNRRDVPHGTGQRVREPEVLTPGRDAFVNRRSAVRVCPSALWHFPRVRPGFWLISANGGGGRRTLRRPPGHLLQVRPDRWAIVGDDHRQPRSRSSHDRSVNGTAAGPIGAVRT